MASSTMRQTTNPQPSRKNVKTRILLISDTHSSDLYPSTSKEYAFRIPLPKVDILIHSGDLTSIGTLDQHQKTMDLIKSVDAELKIVIPGNHDLTLDRVYCERDDRLFQRKKGLYDTPNLKKIRALYEDEEVRNAGIRYIEEGIESFTLSTGATFTVYASAYTPEFCGWAFPYERDEDRYNQSAENMPANPIPSFPEVDIMVTHGPPKDILDKAEKGGPVGCEHLRKAVQRARPRLHCFGHIHEEWGAVRMDWSLTGMADTGKGAEHGVGETIDVDLQEAAERGAAIVDMSEEGGRPLRFGMETLFVNASIMNLRYNPVNAPWVVELELPCA